MSRADKRLDSMRQNPRGDWRIDDLKTVAERLGMKVRESGGSHVVFSHPSCPTVLTVPARRPIKPVYIRRFVDLVDEINEES
jgi:predicted RNA binding protein YcfA (HicA-like mRNA interferase family)